MGWIWASQIKNSLEAENVGLMLPQSGREDDDDDEEDKDDEDDDI